MGVHDGCTVPLFPLLDRLSSSKTQVLQDPWWVLPVEVIHGLTFAAMWAATTDFAHGAAPGAVMNGRLLLVGVWFSSRSRENLFEKKICHEE